MHVIKKLTGLLLALLLLLTGCGSQGGGGGTAQPDTLKNPFSCVADVHYNEMDIKAKVTSPSIGQYTIEVLEPASLKGLTVGWNGEEIQLGYLGLSIGIDPATLPDSLFGSILIDVFNRTAAQEGMSIETGENELVLHGKTDSGDFTVSMDRETGALKSVSVPSVGLEAQFSEFTTGGE